MGTSGNLSYLNGCKVCYDYCDSSVACMEMFYELVEKVGYETAGRIQMYLMLPGMQMNEDGLRLIANNNDAKCISKLVREGHKYLMLYLDDAAYGGWDDVLAT